MISSRYDKWAILVDSGRLEGELHWRELPLCCGSRMATHRRTLVGARLPHPATLYIEPKLALPACAFGLRWSLMEGFF